MKVSLAITSVLFSVSLGSAAAVDESTDAANGLAQAATGWGGCGGTDTVSSA